MVGSGPTSQLLPWHRSPHEPVHARFPPHPTRDRQSPKRHGADPEQDLHSVASDFYPELTTISTWEDYFRRRYEPTIYQLIIAGAAILPGSEGELSCPRHGADGCPSGLRLPRRGRVTQQNSRSCKEPRIPNLSPVITRQRNTERGQEIVLGKLAPQQMDRCCPQMD